MTSADTWLHRLAKLNVYQAKHGRAPHKPLLLLVILELAERGELSDQTLMLTPELAYRFDTFWTVPGIFPGTASTRFSEPRDQPQRRFRN